jgi:hypothetical protein
VCTKSYMQLQSSNLVAKYQKQPQCCPWRTDKSMWRFLSHSDRKKERTSFPPTMGRTSCTTPKDADESLTHMYSLGLPEGPTQPCCLKRPSFGLIHISGKAQTHRSPGAGCKPDTVKCQVTDSPGRSLHKDQPQIWAILSLSLHLKHSCQLTGILAKEGLF